MRKRFEERVGRESALRVHRRANRIRGMSTRKRFFRFYRDDNWSRMQNHADAGEVDAQVFAE
jgi:hypothetical protein